VEAGPDAAAHLSQYPDLGVSARIVEGYDRADGKFFPAAIQHVLGTLDPRIPGMRPWQAVEAANESDEVIDLTAIDAPPGAPEPPAGPRQQPPANTLPTEEPRMALSTEQESKLAKLLDLPDDKFDALLSAATAEPPAGGAEGEPDGTEESELTDAELEALMADVDAEIAAEAAAGGQEGTPAAEPEPALAGAQLSQEARDAIDLANARAEENEQALRRMRRQLDVTTYEKERDKLARVDGIPPRITDLARVLLEGEGRVVELANGKNADAGAIMRKVLEEVGKTVRMLDLSAELGTPLDGGEEAARAAEAETERQRDELKKAVRQMAGI
jgi:hypothetical protein